jgi:hypothetical protein
MAEDRTLEIARATDTADDDDLTKEQLQRRMEQARENITQTVTEIKETVVNQYESVRETINETLDWREQFRKRPVAWSVGALSVGFLTGYCIAGTVKGSGSSRSDYPSAEETDVWNVSSAPAPARLQSSRATSSPAQAFAAQSIAGGAYGSTEYDAGQADSASALSTGGSETAVEQPSGPSLLDRFKETKAFDRLQDEVSKLGDRFIDQLSTVGQEVVLPALFGKIKELFGVDLSNEQQQGQSTGGGRARAAAAGASSSSSLADASRGGSQAGAVSDMGGMSANAGGSSRSGGGSDASRDDYGRSNAAGSVLNNAQ